MHTPSALLKTELELAQALKQLLLQEKEVLGERDLPALQKITETKLQLVNSLENQARQRTAMVAANPDREAAWEMLLETGGPELQNSWRQLKEELKLCQEVNRINELVVNRSRKATEHVLNILRGGPAQQNLYGKQGNKITSRAMSAYISA